MIAESLNTSIKVGNTNRAYYAAEAALETALYENTGRAMGVEIADEALDFSEINTTFAKYTISSGKESARVTGGSDTYDTVYLPHQQNMSVASDEIDLENWQKVEFGDTVTYNLYADTDSSRRCKLAIDGTGDECDDNIVGDAQHPSNANGISASNIVSVLGSEHTDSDIGLEDMFIEMYLPLTDFTVDDANRILLSWQLQAETSEDQQTNHDFAEVMSLQGTDSCDNDDGDYLGAICLGQFDFAASGTDSASTDGEGNIQQWIVKDDSVTPIGHTVRISNIVGLIASKTVNNYSYPVRVAGREEGDGDKTIFSGGSFSGSFASKYFDYDQSSSPAFTEQSQSYSLFFPTLTISLGSRVSNAANTETLREAYIRTGFKFSSAGKLDGNALLPDEVVTTTASGTAGSSTQTIQVTTAPSSSLPYFNFAVFQQ